MNCKKIFIPEQRGPLLLTKSVYEFWLSQGKDKLRLPVLPEAIDIANSVQNDSVKVTGLGEVTFIEEPGAKEISFSSFFRSDTARLPNIKVFLRRKKPFQKLKHG